VKGGEGRRREKTNRKKGGGFLVGLVVLVLCDRDPGGGEREKNWKKERKYRLGEQPSDSPLICPRKRSVPPREKGEKKDHRKGKGRGKAQSNHLFFAVRIVEREEERTGEKGKKERGCDQIPSSPTTIAFNVFGEKGGKKSFQREGEMGRSMPHKLSLYLPLVTSL